MSLFTSKQKLTYVLSISLKSSSIDLQLIQHHENLTRTVVYLQRKIILLKNSTDSQAYTNTCILELSKLLQTSAPRISSLVKKNELSIQVVLYAPWFTSTITSIVQKESTTLTQNFLNSLLKNIKVDKKLVNLEKQVIKILVNGYKINEITNIKIKDALLDIYTSYMSEFLYTKINKTITSIFPAHNRISYVTSPSLIFEQIKRYLIQEDNVSFFYVGGEITEVGVIEDDALSFYATFPIGKHDFLREIQLNSTGYDYDLLYQNEVQLKPKIKQTKFETLKDTWAHMLLQTLLSYKKDIPTKLLLISDSKTRDFFLEMLSAQLKNNPETTSLKYRIINFDISHLKDIISYNTPTYTNELDLQLEALI